MTPPQLDLVASLAGRYTIERELGRGGMATVYLRVNGDDTLRTGERERPCPFPMPVSLCSAR
jgi:hypothetical protein